MAPGDPVSHWSQENPSFLETPLHLCHLWFLEVQGDHHTPCDLWVLENQTFHNLEDLEHQAVLESQIPPFLLGYLVNLLSHHYLVFQCLEFLVVLVGLFHLGALPLLVPLEGLVFLGSLAVQESHLSLVYQPLGSPPVQEALVVHQVPLTLVNQEVQVLSLP